MSTLNYTGYEALNDFVQNKSGGFILVGYYNCKEYEGMVLSIMIVFDTQKAKYQLDLQWMSSGLDFYGDTLQETYLYQFDNLEEVLAYILAKYDIKITDIPVKYSYDYNQYPNPLKDEAKKPQYEAAWQRFLDDFKSGAFLDPSLKLIYPKAR